MNDPQLLIFDLDGTLVDSRRDLIDCVNATLQHCQLPALDDDQIASFIGDGVTALVGRALQAAASDASFAHPEALPFFLCYYREHLLDHTYAYPDVRATLEKIQQMPNAPLMAVLTNKPVNPSRIICDALQLTPYFFANYGGNSFPTKKPHPQGLHALWQEAEAIRGERLQAQQVVLIGDSEVDIRTARNAGVRSWGCTWGLATAKMLAEGPDALARTPGDWLALLRVQPANA